MDENQTALDHPFIQFAHRLQSQTLVQQALIRLEEQCGLIANLVLHLFWIAQTAKGRLRKQHLQSLEAAIHPWHERILSALENLKSLAENAKRNTADLQMLIQKEVMIANQVEQLLLAGAVILTTQQRNNAQKLNDACYNILYCCKLSQHTLNADDQQALLLLLQAVFPDFTQSDIYSALQQTMHNLKIPEKAFSQLELM